MAWEYLGTFLLALVGGGIGSTAVGLYAAKLQRRTSAETAQLERDRFVREIELQEREHAENERERLSTYRARRFDVYQKVKTLSSDLHDFQEVLFVEYKGKRLTVAQYGELLERWVELGKRSIRVANELNGVHDVLVLRALACSRQWLSVTVSSFAKDEQYSDEYSSNYREDAEVNAGLCLAALDNRLGHALLAAEKDLPVPTEVEPGTLPSPEGSDGGNDASAVRPPEE